MRAVDVQRASVCWQLALIYLVDLVVFSKSALDHIRQVQAYLDAFIMTGQPQLEEVQVLR